MGLDRGELAARMAASLLTGYASRGTVTVDRNRLACDAIHYADGLLLTLPPTPAPVAPPAGKYVPKVGDVVHRLPRTSTDGTVGVVYSTDDASQGRPIKIVGVGKDFGWSVACAADEVTYLRDSTPAERAAAGLPTSPPSPAPEVLTPDVPEGSTIAQLAAEQRASMGATQHFKHDITPAPEAKRPTHVRITGPKGQLSVTIGKVYEVLYFDDDRARLIIKNDDGVEWGLSNKRNEGPAFPTWAPAPCPPPVAGRGETLPDDVRELLLDIEHAAKWANQPDAPEAMYVRIRLRELAACAHDILALSRPVRP